jgi:hypothetical protein
MMSVKCILAAASWHLKEMLTQYNSENNCKARARKLEKIPKFGLHSFTPDVKTETEICKHFRCKEQNT